MGRRTALACVAAVCILAILATGCTRPRPSIILGPELGSEESETSATPPSGTAVASGPTPTYEMPTLTPTPAPGLTPMATACPPTATPPAGTPTPVPTFYTVQWGDTVYSLARRFGTTVEAIVEANHLANPNLIEVGQTLIIPGEPVEVNVYVVQPGDTLYSIATRYGIAWETLASVNHILNPTLLQVGQRLIIPEGSAQVPAGAKTYVVKEGDTLFRIALMYGTTVEAIAVANNLPNTHIIYPGQVLVIP